MPSTLMSLGGNWSAAASWALVESTSILDSEAGSSAIQGSRQYSSNFTWGSGAPTVDAIALKVSGLGDGFGGANPSGAGTITVVLRNVTDSSDAATVTVNVSDLNASGFGWHAFVFGAPVALANGKNYAIGTVGTSATVYLYRDATAWNWSRLLRTTTTQAPGAGDKLIICGELTGAGTGNDKTQTVDQDLSATSYGSTAFLQSIHHSKRGIVNFATGSGANPKIKWKGVYAGYGGATLNIGSAGTPIPSNSTAEMIFDCAANVDSGLVFNNGFTYNFYGNPITYTSCKLGTTWAGTTPGGSYGGLCSTSGTSVTSLSGASFFVGMTNIWIAGVFYAVSSVADSTHLTTTIAVPTYASVGYVVYANQLPTPETFAIWNPSQVSVTPNAATASDGTTTATKLMEDATAGVSHQVNYTVTATTGTTIFSAYVKAGAGSRDIYLYATPTNKGRGFKLSDGTSFTAAGLTDADNYGISGPDGQGYYRCWIQVASGATVFRIYLVSSLNTSYNGNGTSYNYIWGAMLTSGTSLLAYTPQSAFPATGDIGGYCNTSGTTLTRVQGQPLNGLSGYVHVNNVGYQISSASDVLVAAQSFGTQSSVGYCNSSNVIENLENWITFTNCSFTTQNAIAPSGAANAILLTNNATNGEHRTAAPAGTGPLIPASTQFTFSVYVKYNNHRWVALRGDGTTNKFASFDLLNSVVGATSASTTSAITSIGSGWYRISMTYTVGGSAVVCDPRIVMNNSDNAGIDTYAGSSTMVWIWGVMFNSGSSPGSYQTAITTDVNTGWKSGDLIGIASTSRTNTDCEYAALASDASTNNLTLFTTLSKPHCNMAEFNDSNVKCEIVNLSRNIKIHGTSGALQGYIVTNNTTVGMARYVECYWLGSGTATKIGLENDTGIGTFDWQYCSFHDFIATTSAITISGLAGQTSSTCIFSNNVFYYLQRGFTYAAAGSGTWTISNNIGMYTFGSGQPIFNLSDVGGTFTNNVAVGGSTGISFSEANIVGTFSGNVAHSNSGVGIDVGQIGSSLLSSGNCWRNNSTGMRFGGIGGMVGSTTIDTFTLVGNSSNNIGLSGAIDLLFTNIISASDTVLLTTSGIASGARIGAMYFENGSFGAVIGMRSSHTQDISMTNGPFAVLLRNCLLASSTEVQSFSAATLYKNAYITSQKHDQIAGNHKFWLQYGVGNIDTAIYGTASPSLRLTPNTAGQKMLSSPAGYGFFHNVASGTTCTVTVKTRKSSSSDTGGANYTGSHQRLIVRKNVAAGISADTVLATAAASYGAWETLSGTTAAVTDDAALEFYVDCDGTAGWVNVDDWRATPIVDGKGNKYWSEGVPNVYGDNASGGVPRSRLLIG